MANNRLISDINIWSGQLWFLYLKKKKYMKKSQPAKTVWNIGSKSDI